MLYYEYRRWLISAQMHVLSMERIGVVPLAEHL